jgi:hypothetical protein
MTTIEQAVEVAVAYVRKRGGPVKPVTAVLKCTSNPSNFGEIHTAIEAHPNIVVERASRGGGNRYRWVSDEEMARDAAAQDRYQAREESAIADSRRLLKLLGVPSEERGFPKAVGYTPYETSWVWYDAVKVSGHFGSNNVVKVVVEVSDGKVEIQTTVKKLADQIEVASVNPEDCADIHGLFQNMLLQATEEN